MTEQELTDIRTRMEEEHQKDREALERLLRFLPTNGNGHYVVKPAVAPSNAEHDPNLSAVKSNDRTVTGTLEEILRERKNRTWTAHQLHAELQNRGAAPNAKNPIPTVGVALKKMLDKGKITLVRAGSGRQPHIYQWRTVDIAECEVLDK